MIKPQTLKGFRDFLPLEKRKRDFVAEKVKEVFERFGFEPLESPTLEYADILLGKYGEEADKLVYTFVDRGERKIGLRYDQTVPTARILVQYAEQLPKYFRRYQIQNVFRADKPQKGRFREFTQCDIDIFGSTSPVADAEILACTYFAYKNVGYPEVILKINDRQTLFATLSPFATDTVTVFSIIQSIDKLDKLSSQEVKKELVSKGLTENTAQEALTSIEHASVSKNLSQIIAKAIQLGIPEKQLIFTPSIARGLDYYTGMIYEVIITGYTVGSCGGGGRYDKLIHQLGGNDIPAVGVAFGFDRMVEAADQIGLFPQEIYESAKILVTVFNEDLNENSLSVTSQLRLNEINTEIYLDPGVKLEKQLKYADQKNIPFAVIIGPEEAEKDMLILKDLKKRAQKHMTVDELLLFLHTYK